MFLLWPLLLLSSCAERDVHSIVKKNLQAPDISQQILAVYEPWFGDRDHINVGYSSHDAAVLHSQIAQAKSLGISGFVVDWYGTRKPFLDETFARLVDAAKASQDFQLAIMYDELTNDPNRDMTDDAIAALDYGYQQYIGVNGSARDLYLNYRGQPVIFIWPNSKTTDWNKVRAHVASWKPAPPLLIFKDQETKNASLPADGYYAWIHPGPSGWAKDGSNWGRQYLDNFYSRMESHFPEKIVIPTIWPRFNDSEARWSESRYMSGRCGKTLQQTIDAFKENAAGLKNDPYLLIATWNDYEEGTAIESGIASPQISQIVKQAECGGGAQQGR